jgi:hypothetical protein
MVPVALGPRNLCFDRLREAANRQQPACVNSEEWHLLDTCCGKSTRLWNAAMGQLIFWTPSRSLQLECSIAERSTTKRKALLLSAFEAQLTGRAQCRCAGSIRIALLAGRADRTRCRLRISLPFPRVPASNPNHARPVFDLICAGLRRHMAHDGILHCLNCFLVILF